MYLPKHFEQTDRALLVETMRGYSFAMLVGTQPSGEPFVTHLPFVVREEEGDKLTLEGHMARANPHWQYLERDPRALVVFSGPHAYVSPSLYADQESVPTWNYIAVHAYGRARVVHDEAAKHAVQERLIAALDPGYRAQFEALQPAFLLGRLKAITAFEIAVERLEGKFKLSQNRPAADRNHIVETFGQGDAEQQAVARWMRRLVTSGD
jgi:transcriptional regulator